MKSRYFLPAIGFVLLTVAISVLAGETKKEEQPAGGQKTQAQAANTGTPIAVTMEALQELEQRKKSLDDRQRQLDERAAALDIQEKLLREKLQKMEELSRKMGERLDGHKKEHEERIAKLVTVVETMKPQAAAEYLENLEPELAVAILAKIQVAKAAKILNLVDKKKGARLTELYTGYREKGDFPTAAPPPQAPPPAAEAVGKGDESATKKM